PHPRPTTVTVAVAVATGEQLEFYFSRQNLQTDGFLVSQMNAQMCVPVSVIAQFHKIQQLTSDPALIVESVKDSAVCVVTPDGLKPTIKQERNTIILREIPSETPQEKIREVFTGDGLAPIKAIRSDVGDTWFITMDSEDDALNTILALRSKTFEGKAIKARLKSENILRSFFPVPTAAEVQPTAAAAAAAPYNLGGGGAPGGGAGGGAGAMGMPYGMPGMGAPMINGQPNYGYPGPGARGGMYGRGGMMMQQGPAGGMRFAGMQHAGMVQGGGGGGRGGGMMPGRGGMQMGGMAGMHGGGGGAGGGGHQGHGMGQQQMMGMNAKPQQVVAAAAAAATAAAVGYPGEFVQYQQDEILKIVSTLSQADVASVPGVPDIRAHALVFESEANLGLLMRQRSVSIDECREQLRKGRPVHREGVIAGAVDYGTYMYGEGHEQQPGSAAQGVGGGGGGSHPRDRKRGDRSRRERGDRPGAADDRTDGRGSEDKTGGGGGGRASRGGNAKGSVDASVKKGAEGNRGKEAAPSGGVVAAAAAAVGQAAPSRPARGWEKPEVTQQKQRGWGASGGAGGGGSDAGRGSKATATK
ncbi:unnamed protein product, partial [Laminaria digitata]